MTSLTYESIIKILCAPKFAAGGGIPRDSTSGSSLRARSRGAAARAVSFSM